MARSENLLLDVVREDSAKNALREFAIRLTANALARCCSNVSDGKGGGGEGVPHAGIRWTGVTVWRRLQQWLSAGFLRPPSEPHCRQCHKENVTPPI